MKKILCVLLMLVGMPSHAEWKQIAVAVDVDTDEPQVIATVLPLFPDMLEYLNAENLVAPSRVRVKRVAGQIAEHEWVNDAECTVPDPSAIAIESFTWSMAEYYYEATPEDIMMIEVITGRVTPCEGWSSPSQIRRYKKQKP